MGTHSDGGGAPGPGGNAQSSLPRSTTAAPEIDVLGAASSGRAFGLDLYRDVSATTASGNLFLSPYSVGVALSMTSAGARGATAQAFSSTLHVALEPDAWHRAVNDLDRQLTSRGRTSSSGSPFRLSTANRQFAQDGFHFVPSFLDTLATSYGADVGLVDFAGALEPARQTINLWVDQHTEHRIPELLRKGMVSERTRLVLVNAIFFKASWATQFRAANTASGPFFTSPTVTKMVPQMTANLTVRTARVQGVEVVELPYEGGELSMVVLMPAAGALSTFVAGLDLAAFDGFLSALQSEAIALRMPKFGLFSSLGLAPNLKRLGLGAAFSGAADFSGLSPEGLSISEVVHQAFVKVDETGTEAAAATAVVFDGGVAWQPAPRGVELNRPFVFAIVDRATQALVFIGRVAEP